MAKNELAVIDNFELSTNTDIMEALIEELGEDAKIPYLYHQNKPEHTAGFQAVYSGFLLLGLAFTKWR